MFRIQVWDNGRWCWGAIDYKTFAEAEKRAEALNKIGIKTRVRPSYELFN